MNLTSSLIICTRNRPKDILDAIESIKKQTHQPDELIIVDSSDVPLLENQDFVKNFAWEEINCVYKHTKPGLTYQRNCGITLAKGDIVFFLDDDAIIEPNYIYRMLETFDKNKGVIGGMGSIVISDKKEHIVLRMVRRLFLLQRIYATGKITASGMPTHCYGTDNFRYIQVLNGCGAYRRAVFNKYQFDEHLKRYAYLEDMDFSYRVGQEGPLFFNPSAKMWHRPSQHARDDVVTNRAMYIFNYSYLFYKLFYPKNRACIIAYWWSVIGLFVYAILIRNYQYIKGYWAGLKQFYFQ